MIGKGEKDTSPTNDQMYEPRSTTHRNRSLIRWATKMQYKQFLEQVCFGYFEMLKLRHSLSYNHEVRGEVIRVVA